MIKKEKLNGKAEVDKYMETLNHQFKEEVSLLRSIIINANKKLGERIKWNAPSFIIKKIWPHLIFVQKIIFKSFLFFMVVL